MYYLLECYSHQECSFEGDEQKRYESGVRMAVVFIEWAKEQSWLFAQRFGRYEN